jgi:hypothetical protein
MAADHQTFPNQGRAISAVSVPAPMSRFIALIDINAGHDFRIHLVARSHLEMHVGVGYDA